MSTTPAAPSTTVFVVLSVIGGLVLLALVVCVLLHCARSIGAERDDDAPIVVPIQRDERAFAEWRRREFLRREDAGLRMFEARWTPEQRAAYPQDYEREWRDFRELEQAEFLRA